MLSADRYYFDAYRELMAIVGLATVAITGITGPAVYAL